MSDSSSGLGNAASDLSGAAGQLGNAANQIPTGGYGTGTPTTNGGFPTGGTLGDGGMPTSGGTGGPDCSCSCMPMDSDPNRFLRNQHVCSECGEEMDWDPINKEKVIMCPSCNKEYVHGEKFCIDVHRPLNLKKHIIKYDIVSSSRVTKY